MRLCSRRNESEECNDEKIASLRTFLLAIGIGGQRHAQAESCDPLNLMTKPSQEKTGGDSEWPKRRRKMQCKEQEAPALALGNGKCTEDNAILKARLTEEIHALRFAVDMSRRREVSSVDVYLQMREQLQKVKAVVGGASRVSPRTEMSETVTQKDSQADDKK